MGCGGSKLEESQNQQALVKLCRERKDLLKSTSDNRFALAAAHVAYFRQLRDVGETLWRFVEEELVLLSSSSTTPSSLSSLSSPVYTVKSTEKKTKGKNTEDDHLNWSSSEGSGDAEHVQEHVSASPVPESNKKNKNNGKRNGKSGSGSGSGSRAGVGFVQPGISYIPDPDPYPDPRMPYYSNGYDPSYSNYSNAGENYVDLGFNSSSNYSNRDNYADLGFNSSSNFNYNSNYPDNFNDNGASSYGFSTNGPSYTSYYMKKSASRIPSVIYEEPKYVNNPIYSFPGASDSNYTQGFSYGNVGSGSGSGNVGHRQQDRQRVEEEKKAVPPPSPKVSAWDYFNPFETGGFGGGGFYSGVDQYGNVGMGVGVGMGGYESNTSSPDSREVREREGIPDLEEETETEVSFPSSSTKTEMKRGGLQKGGRGGRSVHFQERVDDIPVKDKGKRRSNNNNNNTNNNNVRSSSSSSRSSGNFDEGSSRRTTFVEPEPELEVVNEEIEVEDSSLSPETEASVVTLSTSSDEHEHLHEVEVEDEHEGDQERTYVKKKGVSFEVDGGGVGSSHEVQSSKPSSLTTLSRDGTRDLREVVKEIKDEFEAATDYGKEVSTLLEVGREPYKARSTFLKVIIAKMCSSSLPSSHSPSGIATGYPEELDSRSLASTLDKLYVWEKKLYKEVKDEEKLRLMYEKQCNKLRALGKRGAESSKIEATHLYIRKLLTQINVSVRAVDAISTRIHKLRDEELQPQLKELIYGLRKMWKLMLRCHHKQFQAILESKTRALRANTGLRKDSSVRATLQLEAELLKWCQRFNNWVEMQRSYAETLNGWLERCIQYEPEVTSDGVMPFSPGRIGAPPVFVICHDWKQAMERVSESEVQTAMNDFATSLHQLWERQDEEQRRRLKSENMYKDFEKQIRATRVERQRKGQENSDTFSDKNSLSIVASDSGISPLDDLKVDLDSMRQRVREERAGHKEAVKLVHDAVSRSIQAGLIPIFESLESFTSEASKALNDVRLEHVGVSS